MTTEPARGVSPEWVVEQWGCTRRAAIKHIRNAGGWQIQDGVWRVSVPDWDRYIDKREGWHEGSIYAPNKPGVYCVQGVSGYVKIGKANSISQRMRDLQVGHPEELRLLAILSENPDDEGAFHKRFAESRYRGEWYRLTADIRLAIINANRSAA